MNNVIDSLDPAAKQLAYDLAAERVREIFLRAPDQLTALRQEIRRRELDEYFNIPPAYQALIPPARYKGAHGGRGSAKSHNFAELLIAKARRQKGLRWVCVREHQKSLEQSVKRLLEDKIEHYCVGKSFRVLNTHIETPDNGIIIFEGMKNHTADSIKSLEGYDGAWVEEAQSFSQRSLDLLRPTLRKEGSEIWFSWNPRLETDPVDKLLRSENTPPSCVVVKTTYDDNPYFPDVLRMEMEWDKSRDIEKYDHIWGGEYEKHSDARVFKNWAIDGSFESTSNDVLYFGADWGFSVDPAVCIRCFVRGKKLFIEHEAYQVGVEIDDLPAHFDKVPGSREWPIIADNARPETISYMKRNGYPRMEASTKGKDSVKEGIIFLQGFDIVIHERCKRTAAEFRSYSYKKDPLTDIVTPVLREDKNHVIDSVRYAIEKVRKAVMLATWGRSA